MHSLALSARIRNLAAAGVVDADKRNLWLFHAGNLPFVLFAILTRNSITGTSVNTPTVVASAIYKTPHMVRYF